MALGPYRALPQVTGTGERYRALPQVTGAGAALTRGLPPAWSVLCAFPAQPEGGDWGGAWWFLEAESLKFLRLTPVSLSSLGTGGLQEVGM